MKPATCSRSSDTRAAAGRHPRRAFLAASLLLALAASTGAAPSAPAARTLNLYGPLTNTTADAAAKARLVLTITGENVAAILTTEAPLSGSGKLAGHFRNGWCELAGRVNEGFQLQFRGALNDRDFRGTYTAAVAGSPVQYGKFQLAIESRSAP